MLTLSSAETSTKKKVDRKKKGNCYVLHKNLFISNTLNRSVRYVTFRVLVYFHSSIESQINVFH